MAASWINYAALAQQALDAYEQAIQRGVKPELLKIHEDAAVAAFEDYYNHLDEEAEKARGGVVEEAA